jgi:hypothetical protein
MSEVKLCSKCRWRGALFEDGTRATCGMYPDKSTIKDARKACKGDDWQPKPATPEVKPTSHLILGEHAFSNAEIN